jgi:hypothetical protein
MQTRAAGGAKEADGAKTGSQNRRRSWGVGVREEAEFSD